MNELSQEKMFWHWQRFVRAAKMVIRVSKVKWKMDQIFRTHPSQIQSIRALLRISQIQHDQELRQSVEWKPISNWKKSSLTGSKSVADQHFKKSAKTICLNPLFYSSEIVVSDTQKRKYNGIDYYLIKSSMTSIQAGSKRNIWPRIMLGSA